MADDYAWWRSALLGKRGPIFTDQCESGYYRSRNKDKTFSPWAYWKDSTTGEQRCHANGKEVDKLRALEQFPYASKNPISDDEYFQFLETGKWSDEDQGAAAAAKGPDIDPEADPVASMRNEIDKAREGLAAYRQIDSDEQAAKAQTLRSALTTLAGKADKARTAEKEPFLQSGRDVDAKWQPIVKSAKEGADAIRSALGAWEDLKRENARRAAQAAEKAAREAEASGKPAPPASPPNTPPPATQIRGASGRAASVSVKPIVTGIDLDKCWQKFRLERAVSDLFFELAQRSIDAKTATAEELGATVEDKSFIR